MTIATMMAVASAFWSNAGYAVPQATVVWDHRPFDGPGYVIQATADVNPRPMVIEINLEWWRTSSNTERCRVIIHEQGHLLGFQHQDGTVMAWDDDRRPTPGACKRKGWGQPPVKLSLE